MNKQSILIVTNYFEPEYAYQEVQIADELHNQGYSVNVLATDRSQFSYDKIIDSNEKPYKVTYINNYLRLSTTILYCYNSKVISSSFNPDLVILIHPNMGLSYHLGKHFIGKAKIVTIYGDTVYPKNMSFFKKGMLLTFKKRWIKYFFGKSAIFANTNRTINILTELSGNYKHKMHMLGIGYDSNKYYYDKIVRNETRAQLGIENKTVIITATRIVREKDIINNIKPILAALKNNSDLYYIVAGFNNSNYSSEVRNYLTSFICHDQILTFGMLSQKELFKLYNASDIGYWYRASISIQQAMGTGVYMILPKQDWLDHLIINYKNGEYIDKNNLEKKLSNLQYNNNRLEISKYNKKYFSYKHIVKQYINQAF